MASRHQQVDAHFKQRVRQHDFPKPRSHTQLADLSFNSQQALTLFYCQVASRHLDFIAQTLKQQDHGFYTIGNSGHEGNAAIAASVRRQDMAFLHYRSMAFMLYRAIQPQATQGLASALSLDDFLSQATFTDHLLALMAAARDPIAGGRHKVFGSAALNVPPQTSTIASHCPKAVGVAFSIARAKALGIPSQLNSNSLVICSLGDASVNHASAQTAFNSASWLASQGHALPLLWVCEDNGWGISTPTPPGWIAQSMKARPDLIYIDADGLNFADVYAQASQAVNLIHQQKKPVFLHMKCLRLFGHAGADIETLYRSEEDITRDEADDPLLHSARLLIAAGMANKEELIHAYDCIGMRIQQLAEELIGSSPLSSRQAVKQTLTPPVAISPPIKPVTEAQRQHCFANSYPQLSLPRTLAQQINYALTDLMLQYPHLVVFGEDVAKKGGVYYVTADLQQRFGPRRVFDTLLDETMILGTAIGMAHNGFLPVVEIQYLAYLHNAEDQLRGEAATLSFFSQGQFSNPMVIRIASFAYQKGFGGHFHNDNSIAVLRDIPGILVACPARPADGAELLRQCVHFAWAQQRVVVFLEPIALYGEKDLYQANDKAWLQSYPPPEPVVPTDFSVRCYGEASAACAIITYGNGLRMSLQAQQQLQQQHGVPSKVIDLRWLVPLPEDSLLQAVGQCSQILIVDEGRRSGSLSEQLMAFCCENLSESVRLKRVTGDDCFIPLGPAAKWVLPQTEQIVMAALQLTGKEG